MGKEAISSVLMDRAVHPTAYEKAESRSSFITRVQQVISTCASQTALVSITLHFENDKKTASYRSIHANRSTAYLLDSLRPLVRKTDIVILLTHNLHFLLLGANKRGGQIVQTRLWDALLWRIHTIIDVDILRPRSMTIGHSAYPTPCTDVDKLIEAASEALLRFDAVPERTARKPIIQQQHLQLPSNDGELPALARKLGIPYLSLLPRKPLKSIQQLVNPKLAQELHCYPLGRERNILTVAMSNPQDRSALARLQEETGLLIFPVLAHPQELQTALEQLT